jgi:hypothetical protein
LQLNNGLMGWVASGMKKLEQPQSVAAATQAIEDGTLRFQTGQAKGFHEDIIFAIDPQRRAEYAGSYKRTHLRKDATAADSDICGRFFDI